MRQTLLTLVLAATAAAISGCGGRALQTAAAAAAPANRPDLVTQSDERPERRRARLRLELAANYFQSDKTTVALDEIKQSLAADPTYGDAYNLRGLIYMRLNDLDLAADSFRRAVAANPRDADALHNHGWLLCQQKHYAEAEAMFERAVAIPQYADKAKTLMTQGLCQVRAGRSDAAVATLDASYKLDPGNPITGYTLANLLFQRGDVARSQFMMRRINNGDYATAESLWLGARIERAAGDARASQQLADQLRKRFPLSAERAALERGNFQ